MPIDNSNKSMLASGCFQLNIYLKFDIEYPIIMRRLIFVNIFKKICYGNVFINANCDGRKNYA
jgi:hypothetical protein